jgi:hypothetical protein
MPVRPLPPHPNLDHLRHQAKDLLQEHRARLSATAQRLREFHPRFANATDAEIFDAAFTLSDAQLATARERGFPSWSRLKRHIEQPTLADRLDLPHHQRIEDPTLCLAVGLLDAGNSSGLKALLEQHPGLVHQHVLFEGGNYFRSPTLLQFVAENPVRHGRLPANIVAVTRVLLEAGPAVGERNEALMLVATGSVVRECNVQRALINLLCEFGADPNTAVRSAAVLDEHDAVLALLACGAQMDLPVAAALGRTAEATRLLSTATPADRHLALAVAAQFNHVECVRLLLDAGENPNRYNPLGGHSHATPLHQAAGAGHMAVVRLLVEHGAKLDQKDVLWHGTPADWAAHEGQPEVETYLRSH